ncbi:hypothetical protein AURDEDRAFT_116751 [Auricularia subglabra TFB-10046 SS5]|uniref:Uncharacterized protein n=1 Tax=Auricularia subglabra (strain TFB-10046 / SS5) TaxID=717982 RepID=J0WW74_AURST|nr:hypothetical protein AURDEDRAFT_116751 [Auricularia subglabra TFB-10046 SS5]
MASLNRGGKLEGESQPVVGSPMATGKTRCHVRVKEVFSQGHRGSRETLRCPEEPLRPHEVGLVNVLRRC